MEQNHSKNTLNEFSIVELPQVSRITPERPFALMGFPRSGTNWISRELEERGVKLATEPFSLHLPDSNPLKGMGIEFLNSTPEINSEGFLNDFVSELQDISLGPTGFKEVGFGLRLPWLLEQVNDIAVIQVLRDPLWIANSFARHDFFDKWSYEERFEGIKQAIETNPDYHNFSSALNEVDKSCWVSKLALIWLVDTFQCMQAAKEADNLTLVSYKDLAKGCDATWQSIFKAAGLDAETPKPKTYDTTGALKRDPYSTLSRSVQLKDSAPTLLSHDQASNLKKVIGRAPLYLLNPQERTTLKSAVSYLGESHEYKGKLSEIELTTGTIYISKNLITNSEFADFMNKIGLQKTEQYKFYHYYADDAEISYHQASTKWIVNAGKENCPVRHITPIAAKNFAHSCGARLVQATEALEMEGLLINPQDANISGRLGTTSPVGAFGENNYGLRDWVGNVYEYCEDSEGNTSRYSSSFRSRSHTQAGVLTSKWNSIASHMTGFRLVFEQK